LDIIDAAQKAVLTSVSPDMLTSVNDVVTRTIRVAILRGKFPPGHRLLQEDLAAQLGVSRQPVREALRRLQTEGLVVHAPRRGMVVREFSKDDVHENYRLRQLLESEAALLAAERIGPAQVQRLRDINQAMAGAVSTDDSDRLLELNAEFHRSIHEAARMPTLARLISQLWVGLTVFTPLFIPGRAKRSVKEHRALIAALEKHNSEEAASVMRAHIERAAAEYFGKQGQAESERWVSRSASRRVAQNLEGGIAK